MSPSPVRVARMFLPLVFTLLPGCGLLGGAPEETAREPEMTVEVNLRDVHRCSRISPEIQITNPPAGTSTYEVRLVEYGKNKEEIYLGGGTWRETGAGLIPEGGLTRHYRGPCPPQGESRDFAFVVSAMDAGNAQPLAVRIYRFTQD